MCLYIDKEKTEAELKDRSGRTFYKTIRVPPEKINTDMIGLEFFTHGLNKRIFKMTSLGSILRK